MDKLQNWIIVQSNAAFTFEKYYFNVFKSAVKISNWKHSLSIVYKPQREGRQRVL